MIRESDGRLSTTGFGISKSLIELYLEELNCIGRTAKLYGISGKIINPFMKDAVTKGMMTFEQLEDSLIKIKKHLISPTIRQFRFICQFLRRATKEGIKIDKASELYIERYCGEEMPDGNDK
jgi:hypothetical protein